jgi:hypothetical protein
VAPRRRPLAREAAVTCDACGYELIGATDQEARIEGWSVRILRGGRRFCMCGDCESHFAILWAMRQPAAAPWR